MERYIVDAGSLCFSPDERHLVHLGPAGAGRIFDLDAGRVCGEVPAISEAGAIEDQLLGWRNCLAAGAEGGTLAAIDIARRLWRFHAGAWDHVLDGASGCVLVGDEVVAIQVIDHRASLVRGDHRCELDLGDGFDLCAVGEDVELACTVSRGDETFVQWTRFSADLEVRTRTEVPSDVYIDRCFLRGERLFTLAQPPDDPERVEADPWTLREYRRDGRLARSWELPASLFVRYAHPEDLSLGANGSVFLPFQPAVREHAHLLELAPDGTIAVRLDYDRYRLDPGGIVSPRARWFAVLDSVPHVVRLPSCERVLDLDPSAVNEEFIGLERGGLYVNVRDDLLCATNPNLGRLPRPAIYAANAGELARIEQLWLQVGDQDYRPGQFVAHAAALARLELPALRSLVLENVGLTTEAIVKLATAPWAKTLVELDLDEWMIATPTDAVAIRAIAGAFTGLRALRITIDAAGASALIDSALSDQLELRLPGSELDDFTRARIARRFVVMTTD
jgi:hypothetical protein